MRSIKDALLGIVVAAAYLFVCAISDDYDDQQLSQAELRSVQMQARIEREEMQRERKAEQAYVDHLLALDRIKK